MKNFSADLHIHTVISPCGDLDMSPVMIVEKALEKNLDIIGITDHNCTKHALLTAEIAKKKGLSVLCGAEVTSQEEAHVLCFMPNAEKLQALQNYIETYLIKVPNDPKLFGEQLLVNEQEHILDEEPYLLINAINQSVEEISNFVFSQGGLFIPAHIERPTFSLTAQLGFVPPDLQCHAMEISRFSEISEMVEKHPDWNKHTLIQSSDAHFINDIGKAYTDFYLENPTFDEIKQALLQQNGRKVVTTHRTKQ